MMVDMRVVDVRRSSDRIARAAIRLVQRIHPATKLRETIDFCETASSWHMARTKYVLLFVKHVIYHVMVLLTDSSAQFARREYIERESRLPPKVEASKTRRTGSGRKIGRAEANRVEEYICMYGELACVVRSFLVSLASLFISAIMTFLWYRDARRRIPNVHRIWSCERRRYGLNVVPNI